MKYSHSSKYLFSKQLICGAKISPIPPSSKVVIKYTKKCHPPHKTNLS